MSLDTIIKKTKEDTETMKLRLKGLEEEITQALMEKSEKMREYSELLELLELARLHNDSPPQEDSTSDDPIPEASTSDDAAPKDTTSDVRTILRSKKRVVVSNAGTIMSELLSTLKGDDHAVHLNGRGADRNGRRNKGGDKSRPDPSESGTIFSLIQSHLTSGDTSNPVAAISSTDGNDPVAAISSTAGNDSVAAISSTVVSSTVVSSTDGKVTGEEGMVCYAGRLYDSSLGISGKDTREEWGKACMMRE
jgi:hypothetical protein